MDDLDNLLSAYSGAAPQRPEPPKAERKEWDLEPAPPPLRLARPESS